MNPCPWTDEQLVELLAAQINDDQAEEVVNKMLADHQEESP